MHILYRCSVRQAGVKACACRDFCRTEEYFGTRLLQSLIIRGDIVNQQGGRSAAERAQVIFRPLQYQKGTDRSQNQLLLRKTETHVCRNPLQALIKSDGVVDFAFSDKHPDEDTGFPQR